jgi:hypothetical protein
MMAIFDNFHVAHFPISLSWIIMINKHCSMSCIEKGMKQFGTCCPLPLRSSFCSATRLSSSIIKNPLSRGFVRRENPAFGKHDTFWSTATVAGCTAFVSSHAAQFFWRGSIALPHVCAVGISTVALLILGLRLVSLLPASILACITPGDIFVRRDSGGGLMAFARLLVCGRRLRTRKFIGSEENIFSTVMPKLFDCRLLIVT